MSSDRDAEIARRAHALWVEEGMPTGQDLAHWLQAEAELAASSVPAKPKPARKAKAK